LVTDAGACPKVEPRIHANSDFANGDFITAVVEARAAFAGDIEGALDRVRLIGTPQARIRALLGIAAAQSRADSPGAAVVTLQEAFIAMQSVAPSQLQIPIADEIAWAQHGVGDREGAAATLGAAISVNDGLAAPDFIKAVNTVSLGGSVCVVAGEEAGLMAIEAGLSALAELPEAAVPPFVLAKTNGRAARGYARCGDEAASSEAAQAAVDLAGQLSGIEKIQLLVNLVDFAE
jgi:hypothetical protein